MIELRALTPAQRRLYDAAVAGSHHRRVELEVYTRDGNAVRSFTNRFLSGAIHGDLDRQPIEVLEAELLDVNYSLDWSHGEHRRFTARVVDARFVPELDEWVEEIVFTGPFWDFDRDGPVVSLTAQGSERLAMGSVRRVYKKPRKTRATTVIRDLLELAGAPARALLIPRLKVTLPERVTVGVRHKGKKADDDKQKKRRRRRVYRATREDTYAGEVRQIAEAIDRDFFTDGRGRFVLEAPRRRPTLRLTTATILKPVTERRGDDGEVTNTWHVLGANPKGPKKRIEVKVGLPRRHPSSAHSLRWNGKPREVIETIENRQLRNDKAARAVGIRRRDRAMRELVERQVDALPVVPWWRPGGLVSVPTGGGRATATVRRWTLPLGPDADPLTLGANRRPARGQLQSEIVK